MNDQYENKVPDDLVVLPELYRLSESEIKIVVNADWYDVYLDQDPDPNESETIYLMASAKAINYLKNHIDIQELGGIFVDVIIVNDVLKRWSIEDEFYHA